MSTTLINEREKAQIESENMNISQRLRKVRENIERGMKIKSTSPSTFYPSIFLSLAVLFVFFHTYLL